MTTTTDAVDLRHSGRLLVGGQRVEPSSDAMSDVFDAETEQLLFLRAFPDGPPKRYAT